MAILNLLLFAVAILALLFQLLTPVVLNIPAMAVILIALLVAVRHFRQRRSESRLPFFAGLNLLLQSLFFLSSLAVFFVITLPNESPEDSPAMVQGLRRMLAAHGWLEKPRTVQAPSIVSPTPVQNAEPVNAPEPGQVQITVEGEEPAGNAAGENGAEKK